MILRKEIESLREELEENKKEQDKENRYADL